MSVVSSRDDVRGAVIEKTPAHGENSMSRHTVRFHAAAREGVRASHPGWPGSALPMIAGNGCGADDLARGTGRPWSDRSRRTSSMTEIEWLACTDPNRMLDFLENRASDRKLRLFAVACCRRVWHLMKDRRHRDAVEAADQLADGRLTEAAFAIALCPVIALWAKRRVGKREWQPSLYMTCATRHPETSGCAVRRELCCSRSSVCGQ